MAMLQVSHLEKSFGKRRAVDDLSFTVREGEVFGLLGPNGAGKSTTLSLISGLQRPNKGSVSVGGLNVGEDSLRAKALIGVVPQEPAIYPQLSARANLKFWGELNGLSKKELDNAVERALTIVGLTDRASERSSKLSGGMKRRLNIAAGLIHSPKLLIMDEPTVGVDPQSRHHVLETVKALKAQGTTIIYTSHYVEEVEQLCDRVAIMDHGRLLSIGTLPELLGQAGEYQELIITLRTTPEAILPAIKALPWVHDAVVTNVVL
ncbi:MAG: ABC transporter ATP-binding protein, partial [Bacillota bacterium]|nr:ABC transporter ATP-binding protein [Bacillota bacterium]